MEYFRIYIFFQKIFFHHKFILHHTIKNYTIQYVHSTIDEPLATFPFLYETCDSIIIIINYCSISRKIIKLFHCQRSIRTGLIMKVHHFREIHP